MTKDDKELMKKTFFSTGKGLVFFVLIWLFALWVQDFLMVAGAILLMVSINQFFLFIKSQISPENYSFSWKSFFLTIIQTIAFLFIIYYLNDWLGGAGLIGFVVLCVLLGLILLFRRRKMFMDWIEHLERRFLYDGKTATELRKERRKKT